VVRITGANDTSAQVVARSPTGSTFCAETSSAGVTYGSARSLPGARAACSSAPLTAHALRTVEIETLCDGIDDDAILLCRSVQRVVREILATPAPA
jgi:hypothetical protein